MIIEHRTFRLAAGVDEARFLEADRRIQQEVAPFQHGFIRRTTARGDGDLWLVETLWFDEACADAAMDERGPLAVALDALLDTDSVRTERWTTLD